MPSSNADTAEVSPAILVQGTDEAGPQGAQPGSDSRRRRYEMPESDLRLSTGRSIDRLGLRHSDSTRMWYGAFSLLGTGRNQTRRGRPGSRSLVTRRDGYGGLTVNHLGHHSHPLPIVSQWSASTSSATRPSIRAWRMMPEAAHNVASERRTECRCYDRKSQCTGGNANGFHD